MILTEDPSKNASQVSTELKISNVINDGWFTLINVNLFLVRRDNDNTVLSIVYEISLFP